MNKRDLLFEIGTEELPPKALRGLSESLTAGVVNGLKRAGLRHGEVLSYATPRRLAVWVKQLDEAQPDEEQVRRGPALTAAFAEDGCPTKAALGFARSCSVEVEALETLRTDKGAWLVHRSQQAGQASAELVPALVLEALEALPIPKRMRWGSLSAEFVRPVHWAVLLFGDTIIKMELLGVNTGRETRGHRFHHPHTLYLTSAESYAPLLESEGHVMADFNARRTAVRAQIEEAAAGLQGRAVIDEALLDEVTAMVEWPVVVVGEFEQRYLDVPAEALISTMKNNQRYFHVVDENGRLMAHFITISNIESRDVREVRAGNERVIRPRFADADFFWHQDRKRPLAVRLDTLRDVVFQSKLGTVYDKVQRVKALSAELASALAIDPAMAERAAMLCKCDLVTDMVGEFPELQGIMGRYYATHDGETQAVADAIDEHYMPRHAADDTPPSPLGQVVAIADRLDTLAGIFGIGQTPSGDKDPFGLRRAALGVARTIIERKLDLDLDAALARAIELHGDAIAEKGLSEQLFDFVMERLRRYYLDAGIGVDVFESVLAQRPVRPLDFDQRIRAVTAFRALPQAEALAAANKRIGNILRKATEAVPDTYDDTLLVESSERVLSNEMEAAAAVVVPLFEARNYTEALTELAKLREAVDAFFDQVLVMAEDPKLRANRLALLGRLRGLFLEAADLSRLQT